MAFAPSSETSPPPRPAPSPGHGAGGATPLCPPPRPQVPVDDDYFLESEAVSGDQPIYANTQTPGEDSVYIIPNQ